jgi:hypothetical protein
MRKEAKKREEEISSHKSSTGKWEKARLRGISMRTHQPTNQHTKFDMLALAFRKVNRVGRGFLSGRLEEEGRRRTKEEEEEEVFLPPWECLMARWQC